MLRRFSQIFTSTLVGLAVGASTAFAEPQGEPVKIGVLAPLTGTQAVMGEDLTTGAQMAVDETNAAGGVLGRPLQLVVEAVLVADDLGPGALSPSSPRGG